MQFDIRRPRVAQGVSRSSIPFEPRPYHSDPEKKTEIKSVNTDNNLNETRTVKYLEIGDRNEETLMRDRITFIVYFVFSNLISI